MVMSVSFNPEASVQLVNLGREMQPLLIIDDPILEPEKLVEHASSLSFSAPTSVYYPGLNANLPDAYIASLIPVLRPSLERAFGISQNRSIVTSGFFALATQTLDQLGPLQRIPHYDQLESDCLAIVHYLCKSQGGGTGFFRHQPTGYETVTPARRDAYRQSLDAWLAAYACNLTTFAGPQTPSFTMTGAAEMRFNRMVIYRSNVLHCALFDGANLTDDPKTGRLTANSFVYAR